MTTSTARQGLDNFAKEAVPRLPKQKQQEAVTRLPKQKHKEAVRSRALPKQKPTSWSNRRDTKVGSFRQGLLVPLRGTLLQHKEWRRCNLTAPSFTVRQGPKTSALGARLQNIRRQRREQKQRARHLDAVARAAFWQQS